MPLFSSKSNARERKLGNSVENTTHTHTHTHTRFLIHSPTHHTHTHRIKFIMKMHSQHLPNALFLIFFYWQFF